MSDRNHTSLNNHYPEITGTDKFKKKLLLATLLNLLITAVEAAGGILSGSLALISDALHNLGDGIAVFIAYLAHRISKRSSNIRKTFGYQRIEILAAFINAVIMVAVCLFLIIEAIERLKNPAPIKGSVMFLVASAGLLANLIAVLILKNDSVRNINIRAAYLHLLGDTLSSVTVIAGGILIYFFGLYWLDPLLTILISLYILKETYRLLTESVDILMQSTPKSLNLSDIKQEIEKIPGIRNIHHIHAWNLNDQEIHFEGHLDLKNDMKVSETEDIKNKVESVLKEHHHIAHITLQLEFGCCDDTEMIHHK